MSSRMSGSPLPYLCDGGLFGTFIDWRSYATVFAAALKLALNRINLVVWNKTNAGMGSLYRSQHELLPLFKKGNAPHVNNVELGKKGRWRSNVWTYPGASSFGSDARRGLEDHPTVKPTAMLGDAILDLTNRGEICAIWKAKPTFINIFCVISFGELPMRERHTDNGPNLFSPVEVGPLALRNRVVMAPLTRSRAGPENVPNQLNALYYAQRASAGLIISEATQISPEGQGYISTPGIHSAEQIEGWKCVTKAVHVAGGYIMLQLWHVGRISPPSFQPGGAAPIAPSAIRPKGQAFTAKGFEPIPTPRALKTAEIPAIIEKYAQAARNALVAGFDGVEVHAANG